MMPKVTPPYTYNAPNHGSSIGRLTHASNDVNAAYDPVYDALGRIVSISYCLPSDCSYNLKASAGYDLAGNMTSLTYPSGRKVSFNYNSGNQLDQVQFTQWAGASVTPYTYWSASDTNFYPTGAPKLWSLGNGVNESAVFNKRLQLQQETVTNAAIHTLMDHAFDYGTQNNGNVMSVADQLNAGRTQTFTYDGLNRLLTANESRWGLAFVYDPWGNRLQQNVTAGVAGTSQLNVDNRNRIVGAPANCTAANAYCYDATGDLLNDGFHQYTYDAESRIRQVDGGATTYTYDADGQRVRKDSPSGSTDYVYFGGSIIAEKTVSNGNWTDYVFAGGKRIVKADSFKDEIAVAGNNTAAGQYTWWGITGTPNVAVRTGDKLFFYHLQQGSAQGGMILTFSDGTNTGWAAQDQDGSYANVGTVVGQWHARTVDLSAYAGKTINHFLVGNSSAAPVGTWNAWYSDIAILSADGTVTPVYTGQTSTSFQFVSTSSPMASNLGASVIHDSTVGVNAQLTTSYYHGDQIGSSRLMTAGTGWPIWQGTFLPFGEEYNGQITTNHYKFTGKERDSESGLDYFGARYYGSALGRFVTPDWAAKPAAIPYAVLGDPQTLNLYGYVRDLPTVLIDADGHSWLGDFASGVYDSTVGPLVSTVAHPINTAVGLGRAIGNTVAHPINTAVAVGHATKAFGNAVAHGDGRAIGQVVGTIAATAAGIGAGKLAVSALKGAEVAETANLATRAAEVHSALDPIAQEMRTTAALATKEGATVIAGGARDLTPAQRAALKTGEIAAKSPGDHAEVTALKGAAQNGLTPQSMATTRDICPSCQTAIEKSGGTVTGPRTAEWK